MKAINRNRFICTWQGSSLGERWSPSVRRILAIIGLCVSREARMTSSKVWAWWIYTSLEFSLECKIIIKKYNFRLLKSIRNRGNTSRCGISSQMDLNLRSGEILTCKNDANELRWIKFEPNMDLSSCIPHGTTNSGETGYVGRTFAKGRNIDGKAYGILPGFFVPSDGFISVYLHGLFHSSDVEVLCVK